MFWFLIIFVSVILCEEKQISSEPAVEASSESNIKPNIEPSIDTTKFTKDVIDLRDTLIELNKRMEEIDFRLKKLISDIEVLNTRIRDIKILPKIKLEQEKIKNDIIELNKELKNLTANYTSLKMEIEGIKEKEKEKSKGKKGWSFKNLEEFVFSTQFNIITFSIALFSLLLAIFA